MSRMKAPTEDLIYSYQVLGMSTPDIAKKYGMCSASVIQRLKKHIKMRTSSETTIKNGKLNREKNPNWKGGKIKTKYGYISIRGPSGKLVMEHRVVMEQILGRKLLSTEVVHHIDGNRENNSPENLMLFQSVSDHSRFHSELKKRGKK